MGEELDYLTVLRAIEEIPFSVGKKLLADFLTGNDTNDSITRNRLHLKKSFGSLAYNDDEMNRLIDKLLNNHLIQYTTVKENKFWKVLELTEKGRQELDNPTLYKRQISIKSIKTIITEKDKELFKAFDSFLSRYNDEQKKAIISNNKNILCIAGAGSGKTTVLTKRIEFLINYRSIDPSRILAITFTRKARQEMMRRLGEVVQVETFNSFCEKILLQHNDAIYNRTVRVISYKDKIIIIKKALHSLNLDFARAIEIYFTLAQRRSKTNEQLANIFLNDCFFVRDYLKFKNKGLHESSFDTVGIEHEKSAKLVFQVCRFIEDFMQKNGLRDFADQLLDAIMFFEKNKDKIPKFEHILVDEYQDVNSTQIKLIDLLAPENLFAVGDPRQSIYGWRGSDINYILNFEIKYPGCEVITLTKNYRSTEHIVNLINDAINTMQLPALESALEGNKDIQLLRFDSEESEFEHIIKSILSSKIPKNEIFVLARTNRQLNELSLKLKQHDIRHVVRSDEVNRTVVAGENDITLATVHAIKGLEAEMVFVIGCTSQNFPCKGSEHPVIEMIKVEEYDKEEEERRLLYVAMSRAKKSLHISYTGQRPTYFITDSMQKIMEEKKKSFSLQKSTSIESRLKEWRKSVSESLGVPAYMILHDRTITEIAINMPMTIEDLENIHGIGPDKIMKYGEDILDVILG